MRATRFVITLLAVLAPGSAVAMTTYVYCINDRIEVDPRDPQQMRSDRGDLRRSASSARPSISGRMRGAGSRPICAAASAGPAPATEPGTAEPGPPKPQSTKSPAVSGWSETTLMAKSETLSPSTST